MTSDVVLAGAHVVSGDRVEARSLAIRDGRIAGAASAGALRVALRDHLIFPGLINAHDHLQLNNIPPLVHADPFESSYEWIDAIGPHRATAEVAKAVAVPLEVRLRHGALKTVLAGVTTVAHHDPWHDALDTEDFPVGLLRDFGWSHSLGLGLPANGCPPRYGPEVVTSFLNTPPDRPWIIHLAEGVDEVAAGELGELETFGCLAANTVIVHGVGLTPRDIERVVERGAGVVWCPASNLSLFGRTLDPRRLFDSGRLALGSDSRLTGSRDLLAEAVIAAESSDLRPRELARLMTTDAARLLRLSVGVLEEGSPADCVIVTASSDDPYQSLLGASRADLRAVVRGGRPVIADPDLAPWFEHCGVAAVPVRLDGRLKLLDARLASSEAARLEPGLDVD